MKKHLRSSVIVISFALILFTGFYALTYTNGPPSGNTNAPGDGNCTSCHSGTLVTSGSNWNTISLQSDIPATGYVPDSTYSLTLSQSQGGISKFGFQLTVLRATGFTKAGTIIITNASTTQLITGTRDYIEHTSSGTSGSGNINWSFKWKAPSTNIGSVIFYSVINASNNSSSSSGDMIIAKDFTYSVSSLLPTAVISVVDTTVCVDDTVYLSGSGANSPSAWTWSTIGGTPTSSTIQAPKIVYKNAGVFTVSLTTKNSLGSSLATTRKIYVAAKPTVSISPASPINVCQGDSVKLTAVAGKSMTYLWNTSQTTDFIYVKTAGTYYVTATNTSGCSQTSKVVTVIVNSLPSVSLSSNSDSVCKGSLVHFNANPSNFINYTFLSGTSILQNSAKNDYLTSTLLDSTSVFVSIKDSNNCTATSNSIITRVFDPIVTPVISCGASTTSSIEYKWMNDVNAISYEVSEDSGKTWKSPASGPNGLSHLITGLGYSESVMLYVRAKDHFPCLYSPVAQLTCSSLPCSGISYRFEYDSVICEGDSTSIDLHDLNTSKYAINFENQGYSKDTVYPVKPAVSTLYTILLMDSNMLNCPAIELKANVRVANLPLVALASDKSNDAICQGDSIELIATSGYKNYLFLKNDTLTLQNSATAMYKTKVITDGDKFSVIATNTDGCTASGNDIFMSVYPLPLTGFIFTQSFLQFTFSDTTKNAASWSWDFGDSQTDSLKNPVHTYAAAGLYNVKLSVIDDNGCPGKTQKQVNAIINSIAEKAVNLFSVKYIRLQNMLEVSYELNSTENITVNILNQSGKLIKSIQPGVQNRGKYSLSIPTTELKKGVYVISLNNGSSIRSKKVFIE